MDIYFLESYFVVLKKIIEKKIIRDNKVWQVFCFSQIISSFHYKAHIFLKIFKRFESQTIWFRLYCSFRKHWSVSMKSRYSKLRWRWNMTWAKLSFQGLYKIPSKDIFCPFETTWKKIIKNNMGWSILLI